MQPHFGALEGLRAAELQESLRREHWGGRRRRRLCRSVHDPGLCVEEEAGGLLPPIQLRDLPSEAGCDVEVVEEQPVEAVGLRRPAGGGVRG